MSKAARVCMNCRFWSQMIAQAGAGTDNEAGDTEAMCLAPVGPNAQKYTTYATTCDAFAFNTAGAVDEPPDYGAAANESYRQQAAMKHPNGAPMYAPDGTLLDDQDGSQ